MEIASRSDDLDFAPYVEGMFTDNPYKETAKLAETLGKRMSLTWNRSDHRLLYPGMPVQLMYMKKGRLVTLHGILTGSNTDIFSASEGQTNTTFQSNTRLRLFVRPEEEA